MPKRLDYTLTEAELSVVYAALKSNDADVRQRATALHALHLGQSPEQVAELMQLSDSTLYNYFHRFKAAGAAGLPDKPKPGRPPKADADYRATLARLLEQRPTELGFGFTIWTLPSLQEALRRATQVTLSQNRLAEILHEEGYVYRRPKKDLGHQQDAAARATVQATLTELKKAPPVAILGSSLWTKADSA